MAPEFKVALTADFLGPDGNPVLWKGKFAPLENARGQFRQEFFKEHKPEITPDQVGSANALLVLAPRVTAATLKHAERLALVARWGVGFDNVDLKACTQADVAVTITKGAVDHPVAESILTFMLAVSHNLFAKDRVVREGRWNDRNQFLGTEIREKTLGIVGFGGIGKKLVQLVSCFGMKQILVYDPLLNENECAQGGAIKASLETVMAQDFVSINCPLNESTRNLIGARELALMTPTAVLINTARGGIVNEKALYEALHARKIRAAALDVFEQEPADSNNPFLGLENVILTPHAICWTEECFRDIGSMAVDSILSVIAGKKPHGLLNPEVWDRPGFQAKLAAWK